MGINKITIEISKIDEYMDFIHRSINNIILKTDYERDKIKILIPYYLIIAFEEYCYPRVQNRVIEEQKNGKKTIFGVNLEYNYENSIVVYHEHATLYNIEYFKKEI